MKLVYGGLPQPTRDAAVDYYRRSFDPPVERRDEGRPEPENRAERDWFVKRAKEWSKMLVDPIAGPIAE